MKEITYEETPSVVGKNTIGEAWSHLLHHPALFITNWNYKGAIMSGVMRAPIFLVTYLIASESLKLAIGAALAQFLFRFLFAGASGALIQSFRRVEPAWKALLAIILIVPVISHIFEFFVQFSFAYFTSTNEHTDVAIIRSICLSVISALFTLFIMRRNVMIVGEAESKSLFSDMTQMPMLIYRFIAFLPNEIALLLRRKKIILTILSFIGFGIFAQMVCWAITNKSSWTYGGGKEISMLKYWGIDGIILMIFAVALSLAFFDQKEKLIKY
jgi:hypothetical protein